MGGPRASSIRQIRYGVRCSLCERYLGMQSAQGRERRCADCAPRPHRIYAIYFFRRGWTVNFLHEDLKTPAGRIFHFRSFASVSTLFARRGVPDEAVDLARSEREGRGSFWMMLSDEDLAKLKR